MRTIHKHSPFIDLQYGNYWVPGDGLVRAADKLDKWTKIFAPLAICAQ